MNLDKKIAIIGLGYVGLPLAVAFAEKYKVIGFDVNYQRVKDLNNGDDSTLEIEDQMLISVLDIENSRNRLELVYEWYLKDRKKENSDK
jgi:UDP-N-acetyl-D-galactosamine dehydrogenase